MLLPLLSILGGFVCLTIGADGLVRGAASFARRIGLSPLLIGLTVVAYGTSAPEMMVSVRAALGGASDIALGNVVGSNISNIGLILGSTALLCPVRGTAKAVQIDVPFMIGVSALLLGLMADSVIGRLNGLVLVGGAVAYTVIRVWGAREDRQLTVREEFDAAVPSQRGWGWDLLYGGGGLALLVVGARLLVEGAVIIAEGMGISTVVIGLTVVAIGTSVPELATSLTAALRGHADLALGNVLGSNIVNILAILGVTATVRPIDASGLTWIDGGVLLGLSVLTLPFLWTELTFRRWEGGVLLAGYGTYLAYLVWGVL